MQTSRVGCAALLFFLASNAGLLAGDRFYTGEPLPQSQVALVMVGNHLRMDALTLEGKPKADLVGKYKVEVLPGGLLLCVNYAGVGVRSEGCVDVRLNAQAGHTYYIYASLPLDTGLWDQVVVDFARDEDYPTGKDGKQIRERALKHFRGDRDPAKETVVSGHGQEYHIWR